MITSKVKSKGIAMLERGISIEDISATLDVHPTIVKDWAENLDDKSLISIEANMQAIEKLVNQEILPAEDEMRDQLLKQEVERAATEIATQVYKNAGSGDLAHAKSVQLYASALSSIYATIVLKGNMAISGNTGANINSAFQNLLSE